MANFAPIWLNFNGGEVSPKLYSRVDHEKYPSWCETVKNFVLTPQGMAAKRTGTIFTGKCESDDFASELIPFEYSDSENYVLEFTKTGIRFYTNDGLLLESSQSGTVATATRITKNGHGYITGQYIYLSGMSSSRQNGKVVKITGATTNSFDFTGDPLDVSSGGVTIARVYRISHPYAQADLANIQYCQSGNTLYLFHKSYEPRKLVRYANNNWVLSTHSFENGPWLDINAGQTTLSLSASGDLGRKAGVTITQSGGTGTNLVAGNPTAPWTVASAADQWVRIDLGAGNSAKLRGYTLFSGSDRPENRAPGAWRIEGSNDAVNWTLISQEYAEEPWLNMEGKFFPLQLTPAFRYFQLTVDTNWNQTDTNMAVGWWGLLADPDNGGVTLTLTANNTSDINNGAGFKSTDVGRAIRLASTRGYWVWARITGYTSPTAVSVQLQDYPFDSTFGKILTFQLGLYNGGTRWPDAGDFFQNRLAVTGGEPVRMVASQTDAYTRFQSANELDETVPTDAMNVAATTRKGDGAVWIAATSRGVALGTKSGEWIMGPASTDKTVSSENISADEVTKYGSRAGVRPLNTGSAILFVDKTGEAIRELAYLFDIDGYRAPSLNLLADHIFEGSSCVAMAYQASPHSIVWGARSDGGLRAMSYNRENDIVGWHTHALGGSGLIRKCISITNTAGDADDVYMVVQRTINGQTVHYIERFAPQLKSSTDQKDAHYVDCGAVYSGSPATVIGNLWFLEGASVVALADGIIYKNLTVTSGAITLPRACSKVHIGYSYRGVIKTLPARGGALDGTSQGRLKRHYQLVIDFWRSFGGSFGPDEDNLEPINFIDPYTVENDTAPPLVTGFLGPFNWPGGHEKPGAVCYVHDEPTPCNIRAFLPRMELTDA